jgi:PAP2 superfamily
MRYGLLLLGMVFMVGCQSPATAPQLLGTDAIDRVLEQSTEMMVHDVSNPPLAARFYAYTCLAGYQAFTFFNPDGPDFSDSLNGYIPFKGSKLADADARLTAILSMAGVSGKLQPSGTLMNTWLSRFKDSCANAGIAVKSILASQQLADSITNHLLQYARSDGYKQLSALTKYTPTKAEGKWYPTPPGYFPAVEPFFANIRPFTIDTSQLDAFVIPSPVPYNTAKNSGFYQSALAVYEADKKGLGRDIAAFWDCNPFALSDNGHLLIGLKKISPGAHWMGIAGIAARQANLGFEASLKLRTVLAMSMMDGFWLCWREKYQTDRIRPETAIRKLIDPAWKPFLQTPPFPEYPSGHSVVSSVAAEVLTQLVGSDFVYTDTVERRYGIPDRQFSSFKQAAEEASQSRFAGGIHFMDAIVNGQTLGKAMGKAGLKKLGLSK